MFSWILLIAVLVALVVLGIWLWGTVFGRGEVLPPMDEPASVIEDNRKVLADGHPEDIRFEMVTRGYRPEQVDDVIAQLSARLKAAETTLQQHNLPLNHTAEAPERVSRNDHEGQPEGLAGDMSHR